ncbi:MAG: glycosyltransferase family 39 protein [Candidatus Diapherotrites archaeon]
MWCFGRHLHFSWKFSLAAIVLFSFALRTFSLGSVPPGLYCDEASNGFNAYSILISGHDEHGAFLPLYFEAFGEFKNPVFIYSAVPFVAAFGLSVFSIRLVSAFYATLTVLAVFFLARKMFGEKAGFAAAALLAISPWHLVFSRIAFEAITMPFFFVSGFFFLIKTKEHFNFAFISAACFALAVYSYGIAYIFVPVFLLGFAVIYRKTIKESLKGYAIFLILFLLLVSPLFLEYLSSSEHISAVKGRAIASSLFNEGFVERYAKEHSIDKSAVFQSLYPKNYLSYYQPEFLFVEGDRNLRHAVPHEGVLHWFQLPLILIGIILCIREHKEQHFLLLFWLAVFPIAAASSIEQPHALRAITAIPVFELVCAIALAFLWEKLETKNDTISKKAAFTALSLVLLASMFEFISFESHYFFSYPEEAWPWFQYGYGEAFSFSESVKGQYGKVYFSQDLSQWYDQPYILAAFFTKTDPALLKQHGVGSKYVFLQDAQQQLESNSLYIARPGQAKGPILKTIISPAGNPVMEISKIP